VDPFNLTHSVITDVWHDRRHAANQQAFLPSGDNSIRGYRDGEAAPHGADGLFVGAKSYVCVQHRDRAGVDGGFRAPRQL